MNETIKRIENYTSKEAFCVMQYYCESCAQYENLWNSRDGVTPFAIDCIHCDGGTGMNHVNWHLDVCVPDCEPNPFMRVFVDITIAKAIEYSVKRVEAMKNFDKGQFYYDCKNFDNIERFIHLVMDIYHNGEAPDIITGNEYLANRTRREAETIQSQKVIDEILKTKQETREENS